MYPQTNEINNLVSENTGTGSTVRGRGVVGWRIGGVGLGAGLLGRGVLALPSAHYWGVVPRAGAVQVLPRPVTMLIIMRTRAL